MLYAFLCYGAEATVAGWSEQQEAEIMADVAAVNRKLAEQGRLGPTGQLGPTTAAKTVRAGLSPLVTDGPFAETKEQLLGFWIVDCASEQEAIDTGRLIDSARGNPRGPLEIRPLRNFYRGFGAT
jgi:hypothetical protein